MKRRRLLRLGKWTGLVLCVLVAGVWVGSTGRLMRAGYTSARGGIAFGASLGGLEVRWDGRDSVGPAGFWTQLEAANAPSEWWFYHLGFIGWDVWFIPLWAPFLLLAVPTALLWWRDRRVRPGFCRCGYDLKGLEGRPCPKCGAR